MVLCCAVNCKSRDGFAEDEKHVSFHKFPTDKKLRRAWEERVRRKNFVGSKTTWLCSRHFTDDQFVIKPSIIESLGGAYKPKCVRLIPGAIPTVFDYGVEKKEASERKSRAVQKREIARLIKELLPSHATTSSLESSKDMKPNPCCPSCFPVSSASPRQPLPSSSSLSMTSTSNSPLMPVSIPAPPPPLPAPPSPVLLCRFLTPPPSSSPSLLPRPPGAWLVAPITPTPVSRHSPSTNATYSRAASTEPGSAEATKTRTKVAQTEGHGERSAEVYSSSTEQKPLVYIDHAEDENSSTEDVLTAAHNLKNDGSESTTHKTLSPVEKNKGIMSGCAQTPATFAFPVPREKGMAIFHSEYLVHRTTCIDHNEVSEDMKPIIKEENEWEHDSVMGTDVITEAEGENMPYVKTEVMEDEYDVQKRKEPDDDDTDLEIKRSDSNTSSHKDQTAGTFMGRATEQGHMAHDQLHMKCAKLEEPMSDGDISDKGLQENRMENFHSVYDDSDTWCPLSSDIQKHKRTPSRRQSYRKPMEKQRKKYAQSAMEAAIEACRTGLMKQREAASHFKVPRSTLGDKLLGLYPVEPRSRTILSPEEEAKVVEWVATSAARGCGQSRQEVCLAIQRILNSEKRTTPFRDNLPGSKWYYSFLQRHPNLKERKTMVLGEQRAKVTKEKIQAWFKDVQTSLMKDGIDITTIPPQNVFSVDESGFPFFHQGSVVLTDVKEKHPYTISTDTKQQITVLCAGSAGGAILAPYIIFPGVRWTYHPWSDFAEAHYDLTPNGWVNSEIFLNWLRKVFEPAARDLPRPVILFADGHQSHVNMDVHSFCREHSITYYLLPAHAPHIVQSLDLIFYGVLKQQWRESVKDYKRISNVGTVSKKTFAVVFKEAWLASHTSAKMVKAFEAAGLSPWNPERPDYSKCQASQVYQEPSLTDSLPTNKPDESVPAPEPAPTLEPGPSATPEPAPTPEPGPSTTPEPAPTPEPGPSTTPELAPTPEPGPSTTPELAPTPEPAPSPAPEPAPASESPINLAMRVDQLIDFIIASGWSASDMYNVRRRQWRNIPPSGLADVQYKQYLDLYNSIIQLPTIDNLPLPQKCSNSKAAQRVQIPKYVSGEKFKEFQEQKIREEKDKKEAVEERKRERARKKAEREAEKERKKQEREAKRKAVTDKKKKGKAGKKGKSGVE